MRDVARSNALFGGTRAVLRRLADVLEPGADLSLLDVGTGSGDVPAAARALATARDARLTTIGLDVSEQMARSARRRLDAAVVADAMRLPFADRSADVVTCSQVLHHFVDADARALIAELHRVARRCVIISDLRRSWLAAGLFWLASVGLRFHAVTRHDGVTSVLRGFTVPEVERLIRDATGRTARVQAGMFWRVTATWRVERAA